MKQAVQLVMFGILFVVALTHVPLSCSAQEQTPESARNRLQYTVSFPEAASHYVNVRLVIPSALQRVAAAPSEQADRASTLQVMMPTWTPGSYLIREYARNIDRISASSTGGQTLMMEKITKNRWLIQLPPGPSVDRQDVVVEYQLYCHEMSVRTNWVDQDQAILNGAATFLTLTDSREMAHQVRFELPDRWATVVTALPEVAGQPHTFLAASLDELIDSPMLCGSPVVSEFSAGGIPHVIAHGGDASLWDSQKVVSDVRRIVEAQQAFWGVIPYPRYKFLNVIGEVGGGLEHDNSTLVMTSRWNFRDPEKYEDWLSLISHEFFHTWNVRRLRPVGLTQYDYEVENNTRSLWVCEGITSYYEDLFLVRAQLIDRKAYLKRISKVIEKLQTSPGRNVQSLAESSFDTWIKFYRPDENSSNSRVSYYVKGCVVALLLDAKIREVTNDQRSLDDVMRKLYTEFAGQRGFTDQDLLNTVNQVAGVDMSAWLNEHVQTTTELNYEPALKWLGLQFESAKSDANPTDDQSTDTKSTDTKSTDTKSTDTKENVAKPKPAWLGITTKAAGNIVTIGGVIHGSPAQAAGLNVGDELLAFDDYRVSDGNWQKQLNQLAVNKGVEILVARRGRLHRFDVMPVEEPKQKWILQFATNPSEDIQRRQTAWLGEQIEQPAAADSDNAKDVSP